MTALGDAVAALRAGELVAFPTETVYGLGADASSAMAVARIFAAKGRPAAHPVIVHLPSARFLDRWAADPSPAAMALAEAFWPGPLTLLLPRGPAVIDEVTGGLPTVGLRVPDHPVALGLLEAFGGGVAAPSANRFGRVSPTTAAHVRSELGAAVSVVLDGGPCRVGVESTILDLSGASPVVRRPGSVTPTEIEAVLGSSVAMALGSAAVGEAVAPGSLASHYAPDARVRVADSLNGALAGAAAAVEAGRSAGVLAGAAAAAVADGVVELEPAGDGEGLARVLYDRLRQADRLGLDEIWVVEPAPEGVGVAVRDRLARAAHPAR